MAINFPDSPTISDSFTSGERTWVWNGTTWSNSTGRTPGPTFTNNLMMMGG